jgi:membrane protein
MSDEDKGSVAAQEEDESPTAPRRSDYEPEGVPHETGKFATLKRAFKEFSEDNMTDWAAALTYYGLLSLFPALIALVSIIGIFGDPQSTTQKITDIVTQIGPKSAAETFSDPIKTITQERGAAGVMLIVGILAALWSASGYTGAYMRASNIVWETPEGRPFWKARPLQMLVTLVLIILMLVIGLSIALSGPIVEAVADPLGVGSTAVTVWDIAKWPVLIVLFALMLSILNYSAPNVKQRSFKLITWGSLFAMVVWIIASILFAFYVANFGSYNKTYGALGGLISLLVWMWITNVAILLGNELNAEIERSKEMDDGVPRADREIQLKPRDEPKDKQTT